MSTRIPAVVIIVGLVVTLLALDVDAPSRATTAFGRSTARAMPVADSADALSSTWFCAAVGVDRDTDAALIVANAGGEDRSATVAWHTGDDALDVVELEVAALASVRLDAPSEAMSAVVEVDGGEVGVEHELRTSGGVDVAPCASYASTRWYLANGSTARDASQRLVLFNPLADVAVVDVSFTTTEGRDEPTALQDLPLPAGSTTVVELADVVRRREVTAASVVARRGRIVVDRVQSFDGSEGRRGLSLTLAAPSPASGWIFPEGFFTEGTAERWHLYNPTDEEALATLEVWPDDGTLPEPVDLTIPPLGLVTVDASEIGRVDADLGHFSTVRSSNEVPIVAERSIDARAPGTRTGWTSALGAPLSAERWLLPFGTTVGDVEEWVAVVNPGATPVTVRIETLAGGVEPIDGLAEVELAARDRRAILLGTRIERLALPLLVTADAPVVVERNLYQVGGAIDGVSSTMGIPLR